eukprot:6977018-Pyramimonas_sp.AAC.1
MPARRPENARTAPLRRPHDASKTHVRRLQDACGPSHKGWLEILPGWLECVPTGVANCAKLSHFRGDPFPPCQQRQTAFCRPS